ncbi:hypothetical protein [Lysobacter enzymogenes]|uniref:hypothetical protein n=1 Tax=Lysobacter enzymogenes TaxID=69 RepID=UPI000F4C197C|nr:hypothetical protein [Lysobacter enzymogenes]
MIKRRENSEAETRLVSVTWGKLQGSADQSVAAARSVILDWAAKRSSEAFPPQAKSGFPFSLALGNGDAIAGSGVWAFRFDTADDRLRDEEGVERRWRTEVVIADIPGQAQADLSVRLSVVTAVPGIAYVPSAPAMLRGVAQSPGVIFDDISASDYLQANVSFILELLPVRTRRPLIVISTDDAGRGVVDARRLHAAAIGFAHVVCLDPKAMRDFNRAVGRKWAVYPGGVRIYYPGVDLSGSDYRRHPIWSPSSISLNGDGLGIKQFERRLIYRVLIFSASRPGVDDLAPSFGYIDSYLRQAHLLSVSQASRDAEARVSFAHSDQERLAAQEEQLEALRTEITTLNEEIEAVSARLNEVTQERDMAFEVNAQLTDESSRLESQIFAVNAKARMLESRMLEQGGDVQRVFDIPASFEDLDEWAETNFPDRLIFLPKALRAAKKSVYEDVEHIYRCLIFLATDYVDYRRGVPGAQDRYQYGCSGLRVEITPVGSALDNRKYRDQFRAPYKSGYAEIDLHLSPAPGTADRGSVDPKRTYRIYFFWDDAAEIVVVGSLPGHLVTSLTS